MVVVVDSSSGIVSSSRSNDFIENSIRSIEFSIGLIEFSIRSIEFSMDTYTYTYKYKCKYLFLGQGEPSSGQATKNRSDRVSRNTTLNSSQSEGQAWASLFASEGHAPTNVVVVRLDMSVCACVNVCTCWWTRKIHFNK